MLNEDVSMRMNPRLLMLRDCEMWDMYVNVGSCVNKEAPRSVDTAPATQRVDCSQELRGLHSMV